MPTHAPIDLAPSSRIIDGSNAVRATGIPIYECQQEAGDLVFIPEHFSHAVLNLAENQGLVVIIARPDKTYVRETGSGFSPNAAYTNV